MAIKRALISVSDKTGIVEFAAELAKAGRGNHFDRRHENACWNKEACRSSASPK